MLITLSNSSVFRICPVAIKPAGRVRQVSARNYSWRVNNELARIKELACGTGGGWYHIVWISPQPLKQASYIQSLMKVTDVMVADGDHRGCPTELTPDSIIYSEVPVDFHPDLGYAVSLLDIRGPSAARYEVARLYGGTVNNVLFVDRFKTTEIGDETLGWIALAEPYAELYRVTHARLLPHVPNFKVENRREIQILGFETKNHLLKCREMLPKFGMTDVRIEVTGYSSIFSPTDDIIKNKLRTTSKGQRKLQQLQLFLMIPLAQELNKTHQLPAL